MNLKQTEKDTIKYPFLPTSKSKDAHFAIRKPLMEMFGLEPKQRWKNKHDQWTNGYASKHMIPTNKSAPILQFEAGVDTKIAIDGKTRVISAKEVKNRQKGIDLIYDKDHISAEEVHHIQLIKAGKRVKIPSKYKSFTDYRKELQRKSSYIVIRAEVKQYLNHLGKLLDNSIESIVHYTTFPKLAGDTLDCRFFVKDGELRSDRRSELEDKFKNIIKLNALMVAKHGEGLSLVIPNAYFYGLSEDSQKKAKEIFVKAAIGAAKEIEQDSEKYSEFCGIFINTGNDKGLNKLISKSDVESIAINHGDLSAPSGVSKKGKFAESIMGDGVGYVGNGALSAMGNIAVEENLTRKTLGETVLMFSGALNEKVLDKNCYRGESVQSDRVCNGEQRSLQYKTQNIQSNRIQNKGQKSPQHKMQNIQCNRPIVCFAIAVSLSTLIVALASVTQTYIFLAALIIPAAIGLYGWSLYKEEQKNKPSSNIQDDIKVKRVSHNMMYQGG